MEIGKAKSASDSTFFLCPYVRLWATPSSMRLACGRPLPRPRKFILVPGQLPNSRRGPVYPRAGLCRGRGSLSWYPAKLPSPRRGPVYPRADRSEPNRRLFTLAQTGVNQTGACLPSRRLHSLKQAPVYPRAGLCRGRGSLSWYPAKLRCPRRGPVYHRADRSEPNRRPFFAPPERVNTRLQPDYP